MCVYGLGVDGVSQPITYWQSLHEFWVQYFREAGAELEFYSVLRVRP